MERGTALKQDSVQKKHTFWVLANSSTFRTFLPCSAAWQRPRFIVGDFLNNSADSKCLSETTFMCSARYKALVSGCSWGGVFLSLVRQNGINYFSFWPKAKIGKFSPFSPLHPSPSILPPPPPYPSVTWVRPCTFTYGNYLNSKKKKKKLMGDCLNDKKRNSFYFHFVSLCLISGPNFPCREKRK